MYAGNPNIKKKMEKIEVFRPRTLNEFLDYMEELNMMGYEAYFEGVGDTNVNMVVWDREWKIIKVKKD